MRRRTALQALAALLVRCSRITGGDAWRLATSASAILRTPPREFLIWPFGRTDTDYGASFFTERSAREVMGRYRKRGNRLSFDIEHTSAADYRDHADTWIGGGYFDLDLRADGLWAVNCDWSAEAARQIREGERLYFSPDFWQDKKTSEVLVLNHIALCTDPATHNARMLASASNRRKATAMNDKDLLLLGLLLMAARAALEVEDEAGKAAAQKAAADIEAALGENAQKALDLASAATTEGEQEQEQLAEEDEENMSEEEKKASKRAAAKAAAKAAAASGSSGTSGQSDAVKQLCGQLIEDNSGPGRKLHTAKMVAHANTLNDTGLVAYLASLPTPLRAPFPRERTTGGGASGGGGGASGGGAAPTISPEVQAVTRYLRADPAKVEATLRAQRAKRKEAAGDVDG